MWRVSLKDRVTYGAAMQECSHIMFAVNSVQMQTDIQAGAYVPKHQIFNIHTMLQKLCHRYPTATITGSTEPCQVSSDENGVYHILHNAVRNAVKHGAIDAKVEIQLEFTAEDSIITVLNQPGGNHAAAIKAQAEQGVTRTYSYT